VFCRQAVSVAVARTDRLVDGDHPLLMSPGSNCCLIRHGGKVWTTLLSATRPARETCAGGRLAVSAGQSSERERATGRGAEVGLRGNLPLGGPAYLDRGHGSTPLKVLGGDRWLAGNALGQPCDRRATALRSHRTRRLLSRGGRWRRGLGRGAVLRDSPNRGGGCARILARARRPQAVRRWPRR
jgi:hypothetical protein